MILNGKKPVISVETLQADYPDVYAQVFQAGKQEAETQTAAQVTDLTAKLTTTTAENTKLKNEAKIRENAAKLNLSTYGETLISAGKSVEDALTDLITKLNTEGPETNVLGNVLRQTASKAAGQSSTGDVTGPTNYDEAKTVVKAKNPELKGPALAKAVREQFPEIIAKMSQLSNEEE